MERAELLAREAIRELLSAYTWAGDRGRTGEMAGCFVADGVLDVGEHGGRWEGRGTIAAGLDAVIERLAADAAGPVHHHVTSTRIEMDNPVSASVRSYYQVLGPNGLDHWGRYLDRVVRVPSELGWRFAERIVVVDGAAPTSRVVPGDRR